MTEQSSGGISEWTNDIHQGDVIETLQEMPESSVHLAVTSPPYFGLRDYGVDGQIGLEDSLDEYIETLVRVGEELRRVLRDDGNWWLNLGDSFASKPRGNKNPVESTGLNNNEESFEAQDAGVDTTSEMRRKSKMLVPHRVAIALQDAGWVVRSDAVWAKPNPMPNSVKDRLHEHKEFIFHLTPAPDYWFDLDAIREPHAESSIERTEHAMHESEIGTVPGDDQDSASMDADQACHPNGKNPGDILEVSVKPFPDAHFAVYPPELVEKPLKSSCPPVVCASCGTPYERATKDRDLRANPNDRRQKDTAVELADEHGLTTAHLEAVRALGVHDADNSNHESDGGYEKVDQETARLAREAEEALGSYAREFWTVPREADGWRQACDCDTTETEPGIVLDPFAGAGTTCLVAKRLGRQFVGIDLNPDYVALAQKRVGLTVDEPDRLLDENETSLQAFVTDGGQTNTTDIDKGGESP